MALVHQSIAYLAGLLLAVLLLAFFALAAVLFAIHPSLAQTDPHEKQVVADCAYDGWRYCKRAIPKGREALIVCMIANRDRLQPKCSRHLY